MKLILHQGQEMNGSFILYDLKNDHYIRYNPKRCHQRFIPAATILILTSLIGLETGAISAAQNTLKWNGQRFRIASWNQDHCLESALRFSVGWYFKEIARRMDASLIRYYVHQSGYGNADISGAIDIMGLQGKLRISQEEQIQFLKRLYQNNLPFAEHSMDMVKQILRIKQTADYTLCAKSAIGIQDRKTIGWFIGYLEKADDVFFFATNFESETADPHFKKAIVQVTKRILGKFGLLHHMD